ncbi:thermonuclease family protein [Flavobacterium sp.]|uniref:thermonuclease family protein n=2 Tax=Flavobacterium sp. TaxID=239 RepID=UPI004048679D
MKIAAILLFALLTNSFTFSQTQIPKTFQAKVVGIKDGDTFKVLYNNSEITIRLNHIDCPEKNQPYGKNAKWKASDLCFGKMVKIVSNGKKDRYKRLIAEVYCNNININKELIKNGLAWHFKKYSSDNDYAKLEIQARKLKVGLWQQSNPIAPWNWRKK